MISSKRYDCVYHHLSKSGDKTYYITMNLVDKSTGKNKKEWIKIGKHSAGIREAYCHKKRMEELNALRLGEQPILMKQDKTLFIDVAEKYFTEKSGKSAGATKKRYEKWIKPFFETSDIKNISHQDITSFKKHLTKTNLALKSQNIFMELVSSIYRYAIEHDIYVGKNPCTRVSRHKLNNARLRFLATTEIKKLFKRVGDDAQLTLFIMIALTTGGRLGTVCSIRVMDLDLKHDFIALHDEKNNDTYRGFISTTVKSRLLDAVIGKEPTDSIFDLEQRTIQRNLQPILNELFNKKLEHDDRQNRVVIHTLRHTFASQLAINGTPIFTIQKLMNHKDITQTLIYFHVGISDYHRW